MAVYGTNIDINVIGNAIDQLQKVQAEYMRLKQEPSAKLKVGVEDKASSGVNKIKRNIKGVPRSHNTRFSASGITALNARMKSLNSGFEQVNRGAKGLQSALKAVGAVGVAAIGGLTAAAVKGAKAAVDLQSSYKTTQNLIVTGGEGAKTAINAVNQMQRDGKKYSLEYGVSQQKIADAYQDLVKRGHTSAEALGVMRSELQASVASGDDFTDVVKVSSNAIEAFGFKTNDAGKMLKRTKMVVNDLAYAADSTATDFQSEGVAMEYVGSSAHQAGLSLRETAAAVGILSNNNLEADKAGTSLQQVLQHITKVTPQGTKALKNLGLSVDDFQTKSGKLKSLPEIFSMLNKAMDNAGIKGANRLKTMNQIFGTVGGNAANILASNADALQDLEDKIKKAEKNNYVADLAKKNSQTVKMEMARAKESINAVTMSLGTAFMPAIANASEALAKGLSSEHAQKELKALGKEMANFGNAVAKYLVAHGEDLWDIAKALGKIGLAIGEGAFNTLSSFFGILTGHPFASAGDTTHRLAESLTAISKLTPLFKTLGGIFVTYFAASKIMATAKAVNELYKGMLVLSSLGTKQSMTGSLIGDVMNRRAGGAMTKAVEGTVAKQTVKQGVQIAPYLDERGFKGAWSRFKASLPGLGRGAGETVGTATRTGLMGKLSGIASKVLPLGRSIAGKLGAGITAVLGAIDIARGLTPSFKGDRWKTIGKGAGSLIGAGIGGFFGGPAGAAIGGTIGNILGGWLGKAAHKGFNFIRDVFKGKVTFKGIESGFSSTMSKVGKWAQDTWKKIKAWWNDDPTESSSKSSSSHKSKQPSKKVVKSLGGNHYSKTDIANVKAMNKAITDYTGSLKKLKAAIKKNDPTKQLNGMNSRLSKSVKSWDKLAKPIKKIGDAFKYLAKFSSSMSKNDAFATLNEDLPKLDDTVKKHGKSLSNNINSLGKSLNKNKLQEPLKKLNKLLKDSVKDWEKFDSPVKKLANSFKTLQSATKTLNGKNGLEATQKGFTDLDYALTKQSIGKNLKNLANEIKKNKVSSTLSSLNKSVQNAAKYWKELAKPIKTSADSFKIMDKALKDFKGKNNPLDKLEKSVVSLTKTVKKYQFGKELAKQLTTADKAMSGKHSFVGRFQSMTNTIEKELRQFGRSFDRNWESAWKNLDKYPSQGLSKVRSTVSSRLNSIENKENSFTRGFLSSWRKWINDVTSSLRSGFNKLPGIAQQAMQGIVSRLNRGISSINSVISDFGGDKKLSTIHYANGTGFSGNKAHPGGLAVINDGTGPHKQELVWQPSQGWKLYSGLNRMMTLEPGSQVLPGSVSHSILSRAGVPHYAGGTLSDDEEDNIAEAFINNPVKASRDLVLKLTDWNSSTPIIPSLGKATAIGFSRGIANVLKDLLGIIKEPINGDWTPVIKSAARLLHFHISSGQIAKLLRQIQTESGGREVITNNWDSNAKAGHPSQGLLQFIPSTFNAWVVGKYRDINKGFDQILAAINALNHGGEGGWGNIGNGHGWANGGHLMQPSVGLVAEDGDEYIINPNKPNAMKLVQEAACDIVHRNPNMSFTKPVMTSVQYQPASIPVQTNNGDNGNPLVGLVKQAVEKLDNINIRPVVDVATVTKASNKYNAMNYSIIKN